MIPKRLARLKVTKEIKKEFDISVNIEKETLIEVHLIEVPETLIISKKQFQKKYNMDYYSNLNHALKDGVKEEIINIIKSSASSKEEVEDEDITFFSKGCNIKRIERKTIMGLDPSVFGGVEIIDDEDMDDPFWL